MSCPKAAKAPVKQVDNGLTGGSRAACQVSQDQRLEPRSELRVLAKRRRAPQRPHRNALGQARTADEVASLVDRARKSTAETSSVPARHQVLHACKGGQGLQLDGLAALQHVQAMQGHGLAAESNGGPKGSFLKRGVQDGHLLRGADDI